MRVKPLGLSTRAKSATQDWLFEDPIGFLLTVSDYINRA